MGSGGTSVEFLLKSRLSSISFFLEASESSCFLAISDACSSSCLCRRERERERERERKRERDREREREREIETSVYV